MTGYKWLHVHCWFNTCTVNAQVVTQIQFQQALVHNIMCMVGAMADILYVCMNDYVGYFDFHK